MRDSGFWLLLSDEGGVGEALAARLEARGHRCELVRAGHGGDDRGRLLERVQSVSAVAGELGWRGFVHLSSLDHHTREGSRSSCVMDDASLLSLSVLYSLQSLSLSPGCPTHAYFVTRGAMSLSGESPEPIQATTWGIARTAMVELPALGCVCVDLDPAGSPEEDTLLLEREVLSRCEDTQVCYRGGARYVARLGRVEATDAQAPPRLSGTYLVSGGLGGLGLAVAGRLLDRGVERLVLVGRRGAHADVEAQLAALQERADVAVEVADVSNEDALTSLLDRVREAGPPLRGVIHAAGVLSDGIIVNQDAPRIAQVFKPKIQGAWNLHQLTLVDNLESFVLFSSAASVLGNPGQANYAAANGYLDALAHYRRSMGLPALSINWGGWEGPGMAARTVDDTVGLLPVSHALVALDFAMRPGTTQLAVFAARWQQVCERLGEQASSFLDDVLSGLSRAEAHGQRDLTGELAELPPATRREKLVAVVRGELCAILRAEPESITPSSLFLDLGMDSLAGLALSQRLRKLFPSLPLVPTLIYQFPSVRDLADDLMSRLAVDQRPPPSVPPDAFMRRARPSADALESLSEEEVERRFAEKMAQRVRR